MRSRNEQLPVWWVAVRHRKRDIFEVCRHHCICAVPRQIFCYEKEDGLWSVVGVLKIYETDCFMVEWPNDVVPSFKALVVEYARCTHREWLSFTYGFSNPIRLERIIQNSDIMVAEMKMSDVEGAFLMIHPAWYWRTIQSYWPRIYLTQLLITCSTKRGEDVLWIGKSHILYL